MYSPETYRYRIIDDKIKLYLTGTDAICLVGMRWIGKTTTGEAHCKSEISLADASNNFSNRKLAQASPDFVLIGEQPRLIDEWQEVPQIFDAVRYACDSSSGYGHFILTGSSRANFSESDEVFHSGTGRFANITMSSMSLFETSDSSGIISLRELFDKSPSPTPVPKISIEDLLRFCVRGGWPKNVDCPIDAARIMPSQYIEKIINEDFNSLPFLKNKRSPDKIRVVLKALAISEGTVDGTTDYANIIREISDYNMGRQTIVGYIDAFSKLYIIYRQPAFTLPVSKTGSKVLKSAKVRFSDPSLAVAAMKYTPNMLLSDMDTFTRVFDCLCVHDLKVYAENIDATIYHFLEEHGASADALIQLEDGRIGCFKHIVGAGDIDNAAQNLLRVKDILQKANKDCSLLCIICGMSDAVYTRPDGIVVLPLTALKP